MKKLILRAEGDSLIPEDQREMTRRILESEKLTPEIGKV
jgi:hypothetical protein